MLGFSAVGEAPVSVALPRPYSFSEPFDSGSSPWSFDTFNGTAGVLTLDTTNQLHGAGCLDVNTTLNAGRLRINAANLPLSGKLFFRFELSVIATPSGTSILFKHSAPAGANLLQVGYGTGLGLALRDSAGAFGSSYTLTLNTYYRVEVMHDMDASKIQMRVWNTPSSTGAADFDSGLVASAGTPDLVTLGQDSSVTSHHRIDSFAISTVDWIGPFTSATPLTGTPVPAVLPFAAVGASGILGLTGTPVPALLRAAATPAIGNLGLLGTSVPAVLPAAATPASGALGLLGTARAAILPAATTPAAASLGLVGTPIPAISAVTATPATGTLAPSGALTGTPVPALLLVGTVPASGALGLTGSPVPARLSVAATPAVGTLAPSGALTGSPVPALVLIESIPAAGSLGLVGTATPAIAQLRSLPALGAFNLLGTVRPAVAGLRSMPATAAFGVIGSTVPAKLPLLAPQPLGTLATAGGPPTGGSRGGAGSPRSTGGSGPARAAGVDPPDRTRGGHGPARATSSTPPPRARGG